MALILSIPGLAQAQMGKNGLQPTDYGAGYKLVMINQHQEYAPGPNSDPGFGDIKLSRQYPSIVPPLTPDAQAYNNYIKALIMRWWHDTGSPLNNSVEADPDTDRALACEPVGEPIEEGAFSAPAGMRMLPNVISMTCGFIYYIHGLPHARGIFWGFNWLVSQRRPIRPLDVFRPDSGWLRALTMLVNADRSAGDNNSDIPLAKLDYADSHRWVLTNFGLGLSYSAEEFENCVCGGLPAFDVIPWSKLAPYLRKGGIVPESDWSTTLPSPSQ